MGITFRVFPAKKKTVKITNLFNLMVSTVARI